MRFTSGISDAVQLLNAVTDASQQVLRQLEGEPCQLACLFVSPIYRAQWTDALTRLHELLKPAVLIGCSGSGVIGGGQELEQIPALSIVAAHLPDVRLFPFAVTPEELDDSAPGGFWVDKIGASPEAQPVFLVLADPFTCPTPKLIAEINATYRARPVTGGLVSGGTEAGEHLLFLDTAVHREGAVGVAMTGNIAMDTVISQGCRPVGRPYIVTKAEEHAVLELGGRQALAVLHDVLSALPPDDRELAQRGSIFAGVAISEMRQTFRPGDFLIRSVVGIDPELGALAIADGVEVGQTLQFQLRDPSTSRQELRRLLQQQISPHPLPPSGCLLFNCTGRGTSLYGSPHQDVRLIQTVSGKLPIGGFFCNGEIGPVHGTNFLHGYTASLALFRPLHVLRHQPATPAARAETT